MDIDISNSRFASRSLIKERCERVVFDKLVGREEMELTL